MIIDAELNKSTNARELSERLKMERYRLNLNILLIPS
jgi:hypothetical protein